MTAAAARAASALALGLCAACAPTEDGGVDIPADLTAKVLTRVPDDVENPLFVDFGGKVRLLGFEESKHGKVEPGETVQVELYWKAIEPLSDGFRLFTHLLNDRGEIVGNYDLVGPLRQLEGDRPLLPPSAWTPGQVYLDEQTIEIPAPSPDRRVTDRLTLVTGVWRGRTRLDVRSGTHVRHAAVLSHYRTGVGAGGGPTAR